MPRLVWDKIGDRFYETGLDKGVLYLSDGSAIPWNGLKSVVENTNRESTSIYYDGKKVNDIIGLGEFSALMKAITYPDEFVELEGFGLLQTGVFIGDQKPKRFGLCYRTKIGDDINGSDSGYKIHIVYNLIATPKDVSYSSDSNVSSIVEFEWNITAIPEEIEGFFPTAYIVINSLDIDPWLLEELETILYGSDSATAELPSMSELVTFLREWARVRIIDNGDGTWTAISARDGFISLDDEEQLFTIINVNATYLDEDTYTVSNT